VRNKKPAAAVAVVVAALAAVAVVVAVAVLWRFEIESRPCMPSTVFIHRATGHAAKTITLTLK